METVGPGLILRLSATRAGGRLPRAARGSPLRLPVLRAGSWELGAGSWELGAGSWELGASGVRGD